MNKVELSAETLMGEAEVNPSKWSEMPPAKTISNTVMEIEKRGVKVVLVENSAEALEAIKNLIPAGAEVMNGSSTTLAEIGFLDYLESGEHGWKNLHESIMAEPDRAKQADLRRKAVTAEYFLSSLNAIAETGELVACDASGSRVGAFPFAAKNLVLVSGVNKIAPNLQAATDRVREYAFPLENARAKRVYGMPSRLGKMVIIAGEMFEGRTTLVLVKEKLGY